MAKEMIPRKGQAVSRVELTANRAAGVKRCFACGQAKPLECFSLDKSRTDGLQPRCKECYAAWRAQRAPPRKPPLSDAERKQRRKASSDRCKAKNRDAYLETQRQWMRVNKETFAAYQKQWRAKNAAREAETRRVRTKANAARIAELNRLYAAEHRGEYAAHARARQARKRRATPIWAELEKIKAFYVEAARRTAETGVVHHVDHIYPLTSPISCGLHCEANLQILTEAQNLAKRNKMPAETTW